MRRNQYSLRALFGALTVLAIALACRDWLPGWLKLFLWGLSPVVVLMAVQIPLFWLLNLAGWLPRPEANDVVASEEPSQTQDHPQ